MEMPNYVVLALTVSALLVLQALGATTITVEWLPYGSAAQFDAWTPSLLASQLQHQSSRTSRDSPPVELVLLLVRVSDLEAAHPEQQLASSSPSSSLPPPSVLSSESLTPALSPVLEQFASDVVQYTCSSEPLPPLAIILTPSPPTQSQRFLAAEHALYQRIQDATSSSSRVHWISSAHVLELFYQHNARSAAFYDRVSDQLQHAPYTQRMLNALSFALCRQVCRLKHSPSSRPLKKVIVLDCDNTLWGGAVAEVGVDSVALTPPFLSLQRFVVAQQQRGMLVCLCSKNADQDVAAVFEQRRADMVLQLETHVARRRVNWTAKSRNLAALAQELGLGLDAFVFIDDNPLECSEVASALPSVTVIPVPSGFAPGVLDHEWVFDAPIATTASSSASTRTREDAQRTAMYQQQLQRQELQRASRSHRAFLSSLGVKIVFETVAAATGDDETAVSQSFTRVLQLHQRTNQFNTATSFARALTAETLATYTGADDTSAVSTTSAFATALCAHVTDRFGHYGLVSVVLCRLRCVNSDSSGASTDATRSDHRRLDVDTFLLSCRALNRGVEHAMVRRVAELAERLEASTIAFAWEPTDRNEPARQFFASLAASSFAPARAARSSRNGDAEAPVPRVQARDEKLRLSATHKGVWVIDTTAAVHVAFLKTDEDEEAINDSATMSSPHEATVLRASYTPGAWTTMLSKAMAAIARMLYTAVVRIVKRILPTWLVSFVASRFRAKLPGAASSSASEPRVKLLCECFREPDALNAFITKHTQLALERDSTVPSAAANGDDNGVNKASKATDAAHGAPTEQEASKFRRKARHQTKLALRSHLSADAPDVIWSANHVAPSLTQQSDADDSSNDSPGRSNGGDGVPATDTVSTDVLVLTSHKPCATPQCAATVGLQSTCGFQRCRKCCYKIQRLLERLRTSSHETAKATAQRALVEQFVLSLNSSTNEVVSACPAHRNERRRH